MTGGRARKPTCGASSSLLPKPPVRRWTLTLTLTRPGTSRARGVAQLLPLVAALLLLLLAGLLPAAPCPPQRPAALVSSGDVYGAGRPPAQAERQHPRRRPKRARQRRHRGRSLGQQAAPYDYCSTAPLGATCWPCEQLQYGNDPCAVGARGRPETRVCVWGGGLGGAKDCRHLLANSLSSISSSSGDQHLHAIAMLPSLVVAMTQVHDDQ